MIVESIPLRNDRERKGVEIGGRVDVVRNTEGIVELIRVDQL